MVPIAPSSSKMRSRSKLVSIEQLEVNIFLSGTRMPLTKSNAGTTKHVPYVHLYGRSVFSQV